MIIPAAFCGVVGFRPTTGRYPADGLVNLSWTRDTIGIHARTVADVQLVDHVICRQRAEPAPPLDGMVLAVARARFDDVDPAVAEAAELGLAALRARGVRFLDVEIADDLAIGAGPGLSMVLYEAARLLLTRAAAAPAGQRLRSFGDLVPEVASPDVRLLMEHMAAQPVSAEAYEAARLARLSLRRAYEECFRQPGR